MNETKKSLVNGVDVVKLQKRVKKMEKKVKELSERVKGGMEDYQNRHQWNFRKPVNYISESIKKESEKLSESIQGLDTDKIFEHTIWGQKSDWVNSIWTSPQPIIEKIEQCFIFKNKDPEGTVTFTTPKGTLLRAFNYQDRGVLYNVEDAEKLLETKVTDIDLNKDAYGYIPVIGNSMHININKFVFEILKTGDSGSFSTMLSFLIAKVGLYMRNSLNFLEPGTEVFIPHKTGAVLKGKITARNENAPNPVIYSAEFLLRDKIVANTEFSSDDINTHVFLKP